MPVRRALKRNAISLQRLKPTVGFAASLLAVWCQILLLATISLTPLDISAGPVGDVPICHADDGAQPAQQKQDHPAHDCALCVICLSHASALSLLSPMPTLPERRSRRSCGLSPHIRARHQFNSRWRHSLAVLHH